jgi:tetratricopeptide (TPR) repeat protein
LALDQYVKKNYDEALRELLIAKEIDSSRDGAYLNLGNIYFLKKDYQKAIQNYNKAIELGTKSVGAHIYLAVAYRKVGQYYNAGKVIKNALDNLDITERNKYNKLFKEIQADLLNLAKEKMSNDEYGEAIKLFSKLLELNNKHGQAHWNIAKAYEKINDKEKSIEHWKKALDIYGAETGAGRRIIRFIKKLKNE